MNFPKFKLIQDLKIETEFAGLKSNQVIFQIGKEFLANVNGIYSIEWSGGKMELDEQQMIEAKQNGSPLFEKEIPNYKIIVEEVDENDENLIGNWRIQLDVKTTRKKLKEFEKIFTETANNVF
jgi:hypothetical protein